MPDFDAPQSPIEAILQNMLGANNTLRQPQSRNEALLLQILDAMQHGGGDVTAEAVLAALQAMSNEQAEAALAAIDGEPKKLTVTVTWDGTAYTADKTYAEIVAAYDSSQQIVVVFDDNLYSLMETDGVDFLFCSVANSTIYTFLARPQGWAYAAYYLQQTPQIVTDLSSTSITLAAAAANTEYQYGELTALTISSFPVSGEFSIVFVSGSTPTVLTVPQTLIMPDGFAVEANTRYEISVRDGYALCAGWAVSAS